MSDEPRRPITGRLRAWQAAGEAAPEPPAAPSAPAEDPAAAAATRARQRMAFIKGFMTSPDDPLFAQTAVVVRVLEEERAYQHGLAQELAAALAAPPAELSADVLHGWRTRFATAQRRQEQMYTLIKRVTGAAEQAGGSGVLPAVAAPAPPPPPPLETPVADVLDALFED